jgi:sporulation protein YlmC with PRC-barrel domain
MNKRIALSLVAASLVAACSTPQRSEQSFRANPTADTYPTGSAAIDYSHGMWGAQPLRPAPGLVITTQSILVGRTLYDRDGASVSTITAVLQDPATGEVRYVVTSSSRFADDLVIPFGAIRVEGNAAYCSANLEALMSIPRYSYAYLSQTYPPATGMVVMPAAPPPAPLPPVTPAMPLRLAYAGSIVGYPVADSAGDPLGRVEAVAVVPSTGEVRYAIVANPNFGLGSYIEVPASSAQTEGGRVVVNGSDQTWLATPRYTSDQLRLQFSAP